MRALGIIADDLTGACDVGGAFAAAGHRVVVDLCRGAVPRLDDGDVMIVDAGVRDAALAAVRPAMERAFARLRAAGAELRMLKIDSTLRGPVGGMLETALALGEFDGAIVAPAFPEQGRRLVDARLQVHGVDAGVNLAALLGRLSARVRLATGTSLTAVLGSARGLLNIGGAQVVVVDSETPGDLAATAQAWIEAPGRTLLVGSAGLAWQLAKIRQGGPGPSRMPSRQVGPKPSDPWILVVAGSPAAVTIRQLEVLAAELGGETTVVTSPGGTFGVDISSWNPDAKIRVVRPLPGTMRDQGETAAALAAAVATLCDEGRSPPGIPAGLMLVGGDTAARVLAALSVEGLEVRGDIEVGMPFVELRGGPWDGVSAITKAGGFGGERALVTALRSLAALTGTPLTASSTPLRAASHQA